LIDVSYLNKEEKIKMNLTDTVKSRRSIRAFLPKLVSPEILKEILRSAFQAPSWGNTQPWRVTVVGGEVLQKMSKDFLQKALAGEVPPTDVAFPQGWPDQLSQRYKNNGKRLFEVLGIERADKKARTEFMLSMFRYFGAPQAIYIHIDKNLGPYSIFDAGLLAQNITLLAVEKDLGTCFMAASVRFAEVIRHHTGIPESDQIIIGLAIGYPDWGAPVNHFRSEREPLENVVRWVG
jgi:nitroreductase